MALRADHLDGFVALWQRGLPSARLREHLQRFASENRSVLGTGLQRYGLARERPRAALPDLASYDIIEISSSGGKDSQAMLFHVAELLRERGLTDRGVVVHADLGDVEWPGTAEIAAAQAEMAGLSFISKKRPQGDLLEHVRRLGKWPTPSQRYCTADHKRGQILAVLTKLADAFRNRTGITRPVRILNCIGLRAEESRARGAAPAFQEAVRRGSSRRKQVDVWLPIQDWTWNDVWAAVHRSGAPIHPAYAAGLPRASCVFCIFAPESALRRAALRNPALLKRYVEVEQEIGHSFRYRLPIAKIAADVQDPEVALEPVEGWCM